MNTGESHGWPADRPGASGRGAKAGPARQVQHSGPREVEFEEVLAWRPSDSSVVDRKTWRSDLALRLATGVVVAGTVAAVALGAANHTPTPAGEGSGNRPATTRQETPGLTRSNLSPSCLVDWPNQRHVPCPVSLPKVSESGPDCYHPNRVCSPQ
jgi:hypothetical protein